MSLHRRHQGIVNLKPINFNQHAVPTKKVARLPQVAYRHPFCRQIDCHSENAQELIGGGPQGPPFDTLLSMAENLVKYKHFDVDSNHLHHPQTDVAAVEHSCLREQ